MKTFFSTFLAILCAASVIWGVIAYKNNLEAKHRQAVDSLKTSVELSTYAELYAVRREMPESAFEMMPTLVDALTIRVNLGGFSYSEAHRHISDILDNYRMFANYVEKADASKRTWVTDFRARLDKLEAASKARGL